jgi:hypothetical protein
MKINEICEDIEPLKQIGLGLGSKVLNKIPGFKGKARNMASRADLIATANNLYSQFEEYLGLQNKTMQDVTMDDLKKFLKTKKVDTKKLPKHFTHQDHIKDIFMDVAKIAMNPEPKGRPQGGGKQAGKISQTKNARKKRAARKNPTAPQKRSIKV